MSKNILLWQKVRTYSRNNNDISKGHRNCIDRAFGDQMQDNLNIKRSSDSNELQSIN